MNTIKTKSRESRNLLSDFQRFVSHFNPGFVVVENVPGIFNKSDESPLPNFLKFLNNRGYVVKYKKINANHYGVPQNRMRFVLIATRVSETLEFPVPDKLNRKVVRDFLADPKFYSIKAGHQDKTAFIHTTANLSSKNIIRIKKIKKPGGTRLSWKNDPELQNPAYIGMDHKFTDVYGRMWWNKPAPTITTKFHSISNGRFGHPEQHRAISLREGATLQTFPFNYIFKGSGTGSIAKQIGNAVPPELAKRIGLSIINSLKM
jgi:DNA (cytosine-5)-methyltransferase 1